jgi:hypothetical protein
MTIRNITPKSPKGDFALAQPSKAQTLKAPFRGLGVILRIII